MQPSLLLPLPPLPPLQDRTKEYDEPSSDLLKELGDTV